MGKAVVDSASCATQDRLTRGSRAFSPKAVEHRKLASPDDGTSIGLALKDTIIAEGSHGDTMHKLILVRSGHVDIEGCKGGWLVLPGHMIVIPADRAFNIVAEQPCAVDVVHLVPSATPWPYHGCWVTRATNLAREMVGHAVKLSQSTEETEQTAAEIRAKRQAYMTAFSSICSDWFQNARMLFMPKAESETTSRLLIYLRDHIGKASVESITAHLALSQRSLHRLCVNEFGMNLRDLIREVKIMLAMELLLTTDKSVGEIGRDVGFTNLSAFTAAFSDRLNVSPRQFINQIAN